MYSSAYLCARPHGYPTRIARRRRRRRAYSDMPKVDRRRRPRRSPLVL